MQYNTNIPRKHRLGSQSPSLPQKTIQLAGTKPSVDKQKFPPIYSSNKLLMLKLIREEQTVNQFFTNKNNPQLPFNTIQPQKSICESGRNKSHSSIELIPRPGKIIFNKNSSFKIKRKYLITCSSQQQNKIEASKKLAEFVQNGKKNEENRSYCRRKDKNSLHLDKNSYSMAQLFDRMESLKRLFDSKSNLYSKIKRFQTIESNKSHKYNSSALSQKKIVKSSQKTKVLKIKTERSDNYKKNILSQENRKIALITEPPITQQHGSQCLKYKGKLQDEDRCDLTSLLRKQIAVPQEQKLEPWGRQQSSELEEHSQF